MHSRLRGITHSSMAYPHDGGQRVWTASLSACSPREHRTLATVRAPARALQGVLRAAIWPTTLKPYPGIPELLAGGNCRAGELAARWHSNKYQGGGDARLMEVYFPDIEFWWQPRATAPGVPTKPDPSIVF